MRYLGGKHGIAKEISKIITLNREGRDILEPFCGACWATSEMVKLNPDAKVYASDFLPDLVMMWQELQKGWLPPTEVSEEEFKRLKIEEPSALRAFAGFACSFAGMFYASYARDKTAHNYALSGYNSLVKIRESLKNVNYSCQSYDEWKPENKIIYCDPPYENTAGYKGTPKFDHVHFWEVMREWSKTNTVLVSSYKAPEDFKVVWQKEKRLSVGMNNEKTLRMEYIFSLNEIKI